MVDLKQSGSWSALAIALACLSTPATAAQITSGTQAGSQPSDQTTPATDQTSTDQTTPDQTAPGDVSQAKAQAAKAGEAGAETTTQDKESSDSDTVVVTGTRLGRPNVASTAPILSVTSAEIKQQGAISISDILNRLPQVAPDNQGTYQDSTGKQQVQLRGLGFNRTLSLIDGQRISTSIGVDVNSIPVGLVERVDVLTGGAASIYGADAVSGVINFILKKDFTGLQVNGGYSLFAHNNDGDNLGARTARAQGLPVTGGDSFDGGVANINAAWGGKFFDDRLKVQLYGGYINSQPVLNRDRDYSSCYLTQSNGFNTAPVCQLSTSSTTYGVFRPGSGPNAGAAFSDSKDGSRTFVPNNSSFYYEPYSQTTFQRQYERYNAGAFATFDVTDGLQVYGTYMYSKDKSANQFRATALLDASDYGFDNPYTIACNSPLLSSQQQGVICGANAGTATQAPIGVRYRFETVQPPTDRFTNTNQRYTAGLRGHLFDEAIKYDLNYLYSTSKTRHTGDASFGTPNYDNIQSALNNCAGATNGCVPLDIFQANSGSQALIDYIFGTTRGVNVNTSYLYDYTGNLTFDLGKWGIRSPFAEDGIQLAVGGEYRKDKQINTIDAAGIDQFGGGNFQLSQHVKEAYVEGSLPLVQHKPFIDLLSLTGSYRWSRYSISSKTFTTWQAGGLYAPIPDITFRASFNKAARQPTIYEYGRGIVEFVAGSSDPCAGPNPAAVNTRATLENCLKTGITAAQYGNIPQCENNQCLARSNAAHPDPESAHTKTYGILLKPRFIPGLTLSVDYYDIQVDNQIGYSYDSDYVNGCLDFGIDYYCSHIYRNPDGTLTSFSSYRPDTTPTTGFVTFGTGNQYKYSNRGYDFQGQYTVSAPPIGGKLNFFFNGSLLRQIGGKDDPTFTRARNGAGYFGPYVGIPRPKWSHTLRSTYTSNDQVFSVSLNWRHIDGTKSTAISGDPLFGITPTTPIPTMFTRIPSYDYFDLNFTVRVNEHFSLSLLANNLLDKLPPIRPDSYNLSLSRANTIPQTYDSLGRFMQVSASVNF